MDATPVPCGQSAITARRSDLHGWAGYGYCPPHSRWYWGAKLLVLSRAGPLLIRRGRCSWSSRALSG
jgi:hypothetical protein